MINLPVNLTNTLLLCINIALSVPVTAYCIRGEDTKKIEKAEYEETDNEINYYIRLIRPEYESEYSHMGQIFLPCSYGSKTRYKINKSPAEEIGNKNSRKSPDQVSDVVSYTYDENDHCRLIFRAIHSGKQVFTAEDEFSGIICKIEVIVY